eukprot:CAMPEP_0206400346 /NCGR_PEP_ID=MMETSP0294-20121207/25467_1 /ASSEMBLY_ACC=CAM_ASM_000327 /TAXON_ID=39354 /ORGANISM="Heterosigma akashiwo, Strain CCMP2393" /LENGTH=76 /DNA_ID=CAMNT_0053856533 /DNA_START=66 /DNA_END=293 /DNA_ORIENTATION=+
MASTTKSIPSDLDAAFTDLEKRHAELKQDYDVLAAKNEEQCTQIKNQESEVVQLKTDLEAATSKTATLEKSLKDTA